jgi:hypothetical protein
MDTLSSMIKVLNSGGKNRNRELQLRKTIETSSSLLITEIWIITLIFFITHAKILGEIVRFDQASRRFRSDLTNYFLILALEQRNSGITKAFDDVDWD